MAVRTGLEPATSCVTGRHSNQLNYRSNIFISNLSKQHVLEPLRPSRLPSGHSNQLNYKSKIDSTPLKGSAKIALPSFSPKFR